MSLIAPIRRRVWTPITLPPTPPQRWRPNWGNPITAGLAFLFLPTPSGYYDVVRDDQMTLKGAYSSVSTPFGTTWQLGVLAGGTLGYATTGGGNGYYAAPPNNNMSIMSGMYNPGTVGTPTDALCGQWCDASNGFAGNDITVEVRQLAGTPRMAGNVSVASSNLQVQASGGAGITMATAGQGMTYCATYNGATLFAGYSSTALGFGSASGAKTGSPVGLDRVLIGGATAALSPNRAVLWLAGWFATLSLATVTAMVTTNGGLPSGLLRRK